jgi:hypothetical protein
MPKLVKLTNCAEFALVDDEDYESVSKFNWYKIRGGYAARTVHLGPNPNKKGKYLSKVIYMHRMIMCVSSEFVIDHINQDKLDNQKSNLRICDQSINMTNYGLPKNNTSGIKGVTWNKKHKKWKAQIKFHQKNLYLGEFENIEDAAIQRFTAEGLLW